MQDKMLRITKRFSCDVCFSLHCESVRNWRQCFNYDELHVSGDFGKIIYFKSSLIWDIRPCSPLKVNRRFGGTCRLHRKGQRIPCLLSASRRSLAFLTSRWKGHVPLKRRLTFHWLQGNLKFYNNLFIRNLFYCTVFFHIYFIIRKLCD
jgi:hypothetical protein